MPNLTIVFGSALILTGAIVYFATGQESMTALLPSVAGIPIAIAGMIAVNRERRRAALYVAVALVALLALGTLRGVAALIGGETGTAPVVNTLLFIVSVGYLAVFMILMRGDRRARSSL
jgi:hypothetical protein